MEIMTEYRHNWSFRLKFSFGWYPNGWNGGGPYHIKTYQINPIYKISKHGSSFFGGISCVSSGYQYYHSTNYVDEYNALYDTFSSGLGLIPNPGTVSFSTIMAAYKPAVTTFAEGVSQYNANRNSASLDPETVSGWQMGFGDPFGFGF